MKRMSMVIGLVALLVLSLSLTACSGDSVDITGRVVDDIVQVAEQDMGEEQVDSKSGVTEVDLYIFDDQFQPSVIEATAGQTLELVIVDGYTEEDADSARPYVLSFPDFDITERVDAGSIVGFTPQTKGTYEFYCVDCSPQLSGSLIVR